MKFVCSLICVDDIERSTRFYRDVLGQKVQYDFGENVVFEAGFAIHSAAHFAKLAGVAEAETRRPSHAFELYFECDDVEAAQQRIAAEGLDFIHPIREQPWRQRVMRFRDPDGHIVEIGESMEAVVLRLCRAGIGPAEIHDATSMPPEFVAAVLGGS